MATTLHFLLISLLILFISCSHIISCFAIATTKHEEQVQVPSSVTPKAAAVHYWHLKAHNNKPLPPIFLAKLSPFSPSKLIITNDESTGAMSNGDKVRKEKINEQNAPRNRHSTASDDMEKIDDQNAIIYTHAPHDRHPTAGDDIEKLDDQNAIIYTSSPRLHHSFVSKDLERIDDQNAIIYTNPPRLRHSNDLEKIDDQNAIIYTSAPQLHHSSASKDLERIDDQNAIIYTNPPRLRHSNDLEKIDDQNAIIYTSAPRLHHSSASKDLERIDDQNAIIYTNPPRLRHSNDLEKIDDQNAIIYTSAPRLHHSSASKDLERIDDQNAIIYTNPPRLRHSSTSDDLEKNDDQLTIIYTNAPRLRHSAASNDLEKIDDQNAILYTNAHSHRHPTTNDDMEEIDDQNAILYTNNNIKMVTVDELKEKAAEHNRPNALGIFYFREHELKEGKTIPWLKFVGRGSSQYFLPRSITNKIPFSASTIRKIFHIPADSAMYSAMKTTISLCKMPPNTDETKQCVTSGEDMIDYAFSTLGANSDIQVWSTHNLSGFGGKSLIGKVKVVYDGELTGQNHITCHKEKFPYLVYACHNVFKTRVYDLEILDTETKEKINQAAAICHLDTSAWSPDHGSFAGLGSAPGKIEVCHWIAPWDMVWTAGLVVE